MRNPNPDFVASVRFLTPEEGGLKGPCSQGYRCDVYWEDQTEDTIWMIWPMFLDASLKELPKGQMVPRETKAHFYIISDETRKLASKNWLYEGSRFQLREGSRNVAECKVLKIITVHEE